MRSSPPCKYCLSSLSLERRPSRVILVESGHTVLFRSPPRLLSLTKTLLIQLPILLPSPCLWLRLLLQHVRLQFETEQVEDEILEDFPVTIQHKVARSLYRRTVEKCYLFQGCSAEFIDQIVSTEWRALEAFFRSLCALEPQTSSRLTLLSE